MRTRLGYTCVHEDIRAHLGDLVKEVVQALCRLPHMRLLERLNVNISFEVGAERGADLERLEGE